tara:strand:- start:120 stop:848 length:729 start_codon:yes stop_codon:yes gene_type:complete
MNREDKIVELKKYILSLSDEETMYKDGQTYSDIIIDNESLCRDGYARRQHKNQHLRIDKLIDSIGDIKNKTFLELGTNTGYMLFRLKELGADKCVGIDIKDILLKIANKVKDIEEIEDIHFINGNFIDKNCFDKIGNFDYIITFSCINAVEKEFEVSELYERVSKYAPTLFVEFSEYITDSPWEDEFNDRVDNIEGYDYEDKKENFFKIRTEEMFDNADYIESWELLGITDYNRKLYRLDFV